MRLHSHLLLRRLLLGMTVFVLAGLVACSYRPTLTIPAVVKPYKAEIVQGNFVSREQVDALRAGMPRQQVKDILGTPLLVDVFRTNRWDYVFAYEREGQVGKTRRLTVYFSGDSLERWEGDEMPSEAEFASSLSSGRKVGVIPPLTANEKDLNQFSARENKRNPGATSVTDAAPSTTRKTYPPLESQ